MGVPESRSRVLGSVQLQRAGTHEDGDDGGTDAKRGIIAKAAIQGAVRSIILLLYPELNRRYQGCDIALNQHIILRVVTPSKKIRNIRPEEPDRIEWDSTDPAKSLKAIRDDVEVEGQKAIDWYWRAKRWKRIPSQWIQFSALLLAAAAGIVPIIVQLVKNARPTTPINFDSGPLASLFVGIAAALLGLDKAFGYSSGWTRYVLTATSMTKLLHEFRMDWVALSAAAGKPPSAEQQAAMIQ